VSKLINERAFYERLRDRYKGKVYKIDRLTHPAYDAMIVRVEFHIPADEADELELYRRINKVIHVIAEGDDEPK
jgi:hypothetical protein